MPEPAPVRCPMCEQPVPPGANFCGECGVDMRTGMPGQPPAMAHGPARLKWHHNIWVILFLMLFVLGPFALPLVWKHPKLSQTVKWLLTALGLVYAAAMLAMLAQLITVVTSSIEAFNSTLVTY